MTSILRPKAAGAPPRDAGEGAAAPRQDGPLSETGAGEAAADLPEPSRIYREGMSRLVSAVNLVATDGPAGLAGFTATAVTSVSDDPPTLLVCMHKSAQSCARLLANGVFSVNTLGPGGQDLANVFAGRTGVHLDARFASGRWERGATGVPVLADAVVSFACRLADIKDVATHHVLFGDVVDVRMAPVGRSLAWVHRGFHEV